MIYLLEKLTVILIVKYVNSKMMNIIESQCNIINTLKALILKKSSSLFYTIEKSDVNLFLEPLLFSYFNDKRFNESETEMFLELLKGYYSPDEELKISCSFNKDGIAYLPKIGYFNTRSLKPFEQIEIIEGTNIEIVKFSHPHIHRNLLEI